MHITNSKASVSLRLLAISFFAAALLTSTCRVAGAQSWVYGDVFAGVGNGQYNVYSNAGVFKQTITDSFASGYTTGCDFNTDFTKLYTTNFGGDAVGIFDATGTTHPLLKTVDTSAAGTDSESVVFVKSGNYFVGHADGGHGVSEFTAADALVNNYFPATESRGTDWSNVGADSTTIWYTSEGAHLKRYDSKTDTQLADFSVVMPSVSYAHKLLKPFDGTGGALVANTSSIIRLDKNGNIVQTYTIPGTSLLFSLNLDPNGTSFWAGDLGTQNLYRINIASGAIEVGPIATTATNGNQLAGVCVKGELSAVTDTAPPVTVVQSIVAGPPKKVVLATHDVGSSTFISGLASIQVLDCTNCTATTASFTVGTLGTVLTTATKTNQSESSTVKLKATDVSGNSETFDPVDFTIHDGGKQRSNTVEVSPEEHIIMIANGTPGAHSIEIEVNERLLPAITLSAGEGKSVDIAKYMNPLIQNKVTVTAYGPAGATAWIVITQQ